MLPAHNQFKVNLGRARDLQLLYAALSARPAGVLDPADILRAAIVAAVSALDHFVHEITRIGMLEIFDNRRPKTDAFGQFTVTMESVLAGVPASGTPQWLEDEIRKQHGWVSFQQADKIADAIRLVSSKNSGRRLG